MYESVCQRLGKALNDQWGAFREAISGIENPVHRSWYAQVTMGRLLLMFDLQTAGFLGQGDRWYLHTQLGLWQQQPNTFFRTCFRPLCCQGLGLPEIERPLPLQTKAGKLPYLGGSFFQVHPLEHQYPDIDLPDAPFEHMLGWLAEQRWERSSDAASGSPSGAVTPLTLAGALEYQLTESTEKAVVSSLTGLQGLCERSVDAYVLKALQAHGVSVTSIEELLNQLDDVSCPLLIHQILPEVTILDPACGSGRLLLVALARLRQLYQQCWHYATGSGEPRLQAWVQALHQESSAPHWTIVSRILTQNIYGVDLRAEAVETTQLQLWLALLSTAATAEELHPLPDLGFNITTGNALVGLIRVDEEGFDQIVPKKQRSQPAQETVLQGNLLQPLAAASYRDTLREKQIHVEHYRAQTKAMAEASRMPIPDYIQTEFLRDRIHAVNQTAQQKLNRLLWETFSQHLGIRVQEPQATGKLHRRLLTLEDIAELRPLHWGFFFNTILEKQGGFDVILTHPPSGTVRLSADAFYGRHAQFLQTHNIAPSVFRQTRQTILQHFPALAQQWAIAAGRIAYTRDYFRRSEEYASPTSSTSGSPGFKDLFAQRCVALTSPRGIPPQFHSPV